MGAPYCAGRAVSPVRARGGRGRPAAATHQAGQGAGGAGQGGEEGRILGETRREPRLGRRYIRIRHSFRQ